MTQQDTSKRFRAAGHTYPSLSPGTNYQKPDWCSAGSYHRVINPSSLGHPRAGHLCLQDSAGGAGQGTALQPLPGRRGALLPGGAPQSLPSSNKDPHMQNLTLKGRDPHLAPGVSLNPWMPILGRRKRSQCSHSPGSAREQCPEQGWLRARVEEPSMQAAQKTGPCLTCPIPAPCSKAVPPLGTPQGTGATVPCVPAATIQGWHPRVQHAIRVTGSATRAVSHSRH